VQEHPVKLSKIHNPDSIIKIAWAALILLANTACNHDSRTISGEILYESGAALSGVRVTACYSGWGWSAGSLVWDKDYCSDPVLTDQDGKYVIQFSGPEAMRLRAVKKGWVQTRDFNTKERLNAAEQQGSISAPYGSDTYLLGFTIPSQKITEDRVEAAIPSIRAMLDMQIWSSAATPD